MRRYDIVVIGSGAGLMVVEEALKNSWSCAVVERRAFGGTCLNRGCIPTKMLVYPADMIRETERAAKVNLAFEPPRVDWKRMRDRILNYIAISGKIEKNLLGMENLTVYKGTGRFTGPDTLQIEFENGRDPEEIRGNRFVVAAGARSFIPPIPGLSEAGYIIPETFFGSRYPEKPYRSLIIIGGGAIGTEFAHIFSAMGTKVTIVDMKPRLLSTEEEEISAFVERQFRNVGIDIVKNCRIVSCGSDGKIKTVVTEDTETGVRHERMAEEILLASGLRSNADMLDPDKAGIRTDARGYIETDETLATSREEIYAIGDINGKYQFRHKANLEAEVLINNLFHPEKPGKTICYDTVPWAVFTYPQVAHAGLTEREARERGLRIAVGRNFYSQVAGGIAMGYAKGDDDNGFVKIVAGEDGRIVGVHIAGPQAAVLVQPFVYLMNCGHSCRVPRTGMPGGGNDARLKDLRKLCPQAGTYLPISDSMVIHPSMNELTAWALDNIEWEE